MSVNRDPPAADEEPSISFDARDPGRPSRKPAAPVSSSESASTEPAKKESAGKESVAKDASAAESLASDSAGKNAARAKESSSKAAGARSPLSATIVKTPAGLEPQPADLKNADAKTGAEGKPAEPSLSESATAGETKTAAAKGASRRSSRPEFDDSRPSSDEPSISFGGRETSFEPKSSRPTPPTTPPRPSFNDEPSFMIDAREVSFGAGEGVAPLPPRDAVPGSSIGPPTDSSITFERVSGLWSKFVQPDTPTTHTIQRRPPREVMRTLRTASKVVAPPRSVTAKGPGLPPDYEIIDKLGEGGMGVVFLARQTSIDRTIAIKMLKPEGAHDDEVRARFLSEAAVTGALDHPNIVPIHDLGSNEQGALFYSMKRVNGTPWCDVLLTRSTDENLETWMRMADALAFAHSRGIIHRDIKPENVMLGDYGEVLVMDWGLAMSVVEQGRAAYYDAGDSMAGTPAYMAPEMASGSVDQLSFTSDVYLCGAVLFEIVAGFPPHTGKNVMGCLYAAASNQIRRTDKEGELLDIALKAMETNPKERYQSVTELQAAVKSFQSHSESLVLSTKAKESLERAAGTNDYNDFAEALFGFREALTLWSGNEAAEVGVVKAAVAYARSAFDKGDLDLATSLLDAKIVDHQPLLVLIEEEIRAREARQRSYQRITKAATALVVAVFVIIVVALFWINSSRQQAEDARKKAVSAAEAAVRAQTEAEAERVKAEEQKKKADEQTVVAETQKKLALEAKTQAEGDRAAAVQAKTVAENATAEAKRAQREVSVRAYLAQMGLTDAKVRENSFGIARYLLAKTEYDYRGWEFGWLRHLCGMARTTYVGHTRPLSSAAVTRDGRLVTASEDKTLRMWEAASGKLLHVWNLPAPATAVDVSRDGRWAAVGLRSGQTFVYSLSELQAEPRFFTKDERRPILSVTFADRKSTGELFVGTANDKRAVLMYRIPVAPAGIANRTGATSVSFQAQGPRPAAGEDPAAPAADPRVLAVSHYYQNISDAVTCLRYHYETQRLVTAARDGGVWFWDPWVSATPSALKQFDLKNSSAFAVAFSKDGGRIAAVGSDGMVHIWDVNAPAAEDKSFPEAITFEAHPMAILTVDFAPNGTDLLTAGEDNTIRIWHVGATAESVERRAVLRGHAGWVRSAVFDPGSEQPIVYSASQDAEAKAWNVDEYHETVPLSGHTADGVLSGAFSPDGTTAVTGGADSTVRWWDVKLGDQRGLFEEGHNLETTGAAVDRTGRYAVTTCVDGWTAIWDLSINAEARRFRVHQGPATCAAFGPKSDWIATGGGDETVRLTARETGEQIRVSAKLGSAVRSLAVAPDGKLIAAGMTNGKIRLLNAETLREVRVLEGHSRDVNSLCFSPDGSEIYAASNDTTSGCWRVADGQERAPPLKHAQPVYVVTVSPNGKYVATGDFAGRVRLWDAGTRKLIADFSEDFSSPTASVRTGHKSEVHALAFSGDGLQLASGDNNDGEVIVWDVKRFVEAPYARPTGYHASGHVAAYNDGGSTQTTSFVADRWLAAPTSIVYLDYLPGTSLVFAASKYDITVSDVADKRPNRIPTAAISAHLQVVGVAFHPSGKFVVSAGLESVAKIWSLDSQKVVRKLYGVHRVKMTSLDVSRDGRFVATGGEDGLAVVWDFETGKPLKLLGPAGEGVRAVKFSPDGSLVATAATDGKVRLWKWQGNEAPQELVGHSAVVRDVAFSADGGRLVSGGQDNVAILWDLAVGKPLRTLRGHSAFVTSVAYLGDGKRIVTASEDGTARIWDVDNGEEIIVLKSEPRLSKTGAKAVTAKLTSVSFSPVVDAAAVLTTANDGDALVWPTMSWTSKETPDLPLPSDEAIRPGEAPASDPIEPGSNDDSPDANASPDASVSPAETSAPAPAAVAPSSASPPTAP